MKTLWDLLRRAAPKPARLPSKPVRPRRAASRPTAAARYDAMVREMTAAYGVRVRRYRTSMSGIAWELRGDDGSIRRLIEAPRPRSPMSAAVFLHEIGHHAIGFNRYRPRCLEEYHAWMFALEQMRRLGIDITLRVRKRVHDSLHYAVMKARRRGIKSLPAELAPYAARWRPEQA